MSNDYDDDAMTQALIDMILSGGSQYLGGATPTMSAGQYGSLAGLVPSDDDELRQDARGLNFAQDLASSGADTMFLANIGMGAYDPAAFQPMVSQRVVESPALQLFNSYLRNPMSYQGLIAQRIAAGGNPLEVVSELQAEVGLQPDFEDPTLGPLLGQLPKTYDNKEAGGTGLPIGIDWTKIQEDALEMANEWASIPVPGPSGLTVSDTGEIISEGGQIELVGEPGYQQLIETMYTPSPQMEEYQRLGIPLPTEEFTPAYILGPEWEAAEQDYLGLSAEVDAAKQAMNDPSLRPTNEYTPDRPQGAIPNLTDEQLRAKGAPDQPDYNPLAPGAYGFWNEEGEPARTEEAAWQELMSGLAYGGWNVNNPLQRRTAEDAMREAQTTAYGSWETLNQGETAAPGEPRDFAYGDWNADEEQPVPDTADDARQGWLDAQRLLADPARTGSIMPGAYGAWHTTNAEQAQPPNDPTAVYGGWEANAGGGLLSDIEQLVAQAGPQGGSPTPPSSEMTNALLSAIIGGNQNGAPRTATINGQPTTAGLTPQDFGRLPAYAQPGAQSANQPGGPAYMEAIETGELRGQQRRADEQQSQILGGGTDRTGKRVRPTRSPEQARRYRQAFEEWDRATDEQYRRSREIYNYDHGYAKGVAYALQQQGITPTQAVMAARQLPAQAMGVVSSNRVAATARK